MQKIIIIFVSVMLFSCHNGFHSPSENEIEQAVNSMYAKRNEAIGGGGWIIKDVKILSSRKGNDERHYIAEVTINGIHTSPPLANPRPDEDIQETREIELIWRDGGWRAVDE